MATGSAPPLSFLGIAGSLRRGSFNRGLIRAAAAVAPGGTTVVAYDLADVPMFNADVEVDGDPRAVAALKQAIADADALLIATPEYNHCVPGVLKNAIDWASRPPRQSVLTGKPVAIMGASTGRGATARAQAHLRDGLATRTASCSRCRKCWWTSHVTSSTTTGISRTRRQGRRCATSSSRWPPGPAGSEDREASASRAELRPHVWAPPGGFMTGRAWSRAQRVHLVGSSASAPCSDLPGKRSS